MRAVEQLRTSDGWQAWLRVRARTGLRRYSLRNQLLIALQDPDATRVAGFRAWLALGYCVRRGETLPDPRLGALRTLQARSCRRGATPAPTRPSSRSRSTGSRPSSTAPRSTRCRRPRCRRRWIRRSRRSPATRSPGRSPSSMRSPAGSASRVELRADARRLRRLLRPAERRIAINPAVAVNQQAAALVHELAHALVRLDHHEDDPELDYATEELVAESVAFTVCGFLGLDTAGNSVPYLAVWSEHTPEDAFERIAALVDRLARRLEDALEASRRRDGHEPRPR